LLRVDWVDTTSSSTSGPFSISISSSSIGVHGSYTWFLEQLSPLFVHTPFASNISRHHTHESCLHWYNWSSLVHLDSWHLDSSDSRMSFNGLFPQNFGKSHPRRTRDQDQSDHLDLDLVLLDDLLVPWFLCLPVYRCEIL
jgi:hypothetical protein